MLEDRHFAELDSEEILSRADWRRGRGSRWSAAACSWSGSWTRRARPARLGCSRTRCTSPSTCWCATGSGRGRTPRRTRARGSPRRSATCSSATSCLRYLALIEAAQGRERECREHVDRGAGADRGQRAGACPGARRSARAAGARRGPAAGGAAAPGSRDGRARRGRRAAGGFRGRRWAISSRLTSAARARYHRS